MEALAGQENMYDRSLLLEETKSRKKVWRERLGVLCICTPIHILSLVVMLHWMYMGWTITE